MQASIYRKIINITYQEAYYDDESVSVVWFCLQKPTKVCIILTYDDMEGFSPGRLGVRVPNAFIEGPYAFNPAPYTLTAPYTLIS